MERMRQNSLNKESPNILPGGTSASKNALSLAINFYLEIEDQRIRTLYLQSQKQMALRVSWTCLIYNLVQCVIFVANIGYNFFTAGNLSILCLTNGAAILATIISY